MALKQIKIVNEKQRINPYALRETLKMLADFDSRRFVSILSIELSKRKVIVVLGLLDTDFKTLIDMKPLPHDQIRTFLF